MVFISLCNRFTCERCYGQMGQIELTVLRKCLSEQGNNSIATGLRTPSLLARQEAKWGALSTWTLTGAPQNDEEYFPRNVGPYFKSRSWVIMLRPFPKCSELSASYVRSEESFNCYGNITGGSRKPRMSAAISPDEAPLAHWGE